MINVSIRFTVPIEKVDQLRRVLFTVIGPTRAMSGCENCRLYEEEGCPGSWLLVERWRTEADMKRHIASPKYNNILEAMELSSEQPTVHFSKEFNADGLEYIERIRQ
ncbi:antibiotic biosynthesis monooxygenase [bacterium AH-315-K03]|nr:antibiotic biosynthesis monooxygenase [bacterium AH-315-K03]